MGVVLTLDHHDICVVIVAVTQVLGAGKPAAKGYHIVLKAGFIQPIVHMVAETCPLFHILSDIVVYIVVQVIGVHCLDGGVQNTHIFAANHALIDGRIAAIGILGHGSNGVLMVSHQIQGKLSLFRAGLVSLSLQSFLNLCAQQVNKLDHSSGVGAILFLRSRTGSAGAGSVSIGHGELTGKNRGLCIDSYHHLIGCGLYHFCQLSTVAVSGVAKLIRNIYDAVPHTLTAVPLPVAVADTIVGILRQIIHAGVVVGAVIVNTVAIVILRHQEVVCVIGVTHQILDICIGTVTPVAHNLGVDIRLLGDVEIRHPCPASRNNGDAVRCAVDLQTQRVLQECGGGILDALYANTLQEHIVIHSDNSVAGNAQVIGHCLSGSCKQRIVVDDDELAVSSVLICSYDGKGDAASAQMFNHNICSLLVGSVGLIDDDLVVGCAALNEFPGGIGSYADLVDRAGNCALLLICGCTGSGKYAGGYGGVIGIADPEAICIPSAEIGHSLSQSCTVCIDTIDAVRAGQGFRTDGACADHIQAVKLGTACIFVDGIAAVGRGLGILNDHIGCVEIAALAVIEQHTAIVDPVAIGNQTIKGSLQINIFHGAAMVPECQERTLTLNDGIVEGNVLQGAPEILAKETAVPIGVGGLGCHIGDAVAVAVKYAGEGIGHGVFVGVACKINIVAQCISTGRICSHQRGEGLQFLCGVEHHVSRNQLCVSHINRAVLGEVQLDALCFGQSADGGLIQSQNTGIEIIGSVFNGAAAHHCSCEVHACSFHSLDAKVHGDSGFCVVRSHIGGGSHIQFVFYHIAIFINSANQSFGDGEAIDHSPEAVAVPCRNIGIEGSTVIVAVIDAIGAAEGILDDLISANNIETVDLRLAEALIYRIACAGAGQRLSVLDHHIGGIQIVAVAIAEQHAGILCEVTGAGNHTVKGKADIHIFQLACNTPECQECALTLNGCIGKGNILYGTGKELTEEAAVPIVGSGLSGHIVDHIALTVEGAGEVIGGIAVSISNAGHINVVGQHISTCQVLCHHGGEIGHFCRCADHISSRSDFCTNDESCAGALKGQCNGFLTA